MFITFEGIDGCGKSTQLQLLAERLSQAEYSVCTTREPGGTELAEKIRDYLLHSSQPLDKRTELLLFGAARAQHVAQVIRPSLGCSKFVLSDRFGDSSVAYQAGGLGLDRDFILEMNAFATGNLQPDITFYFDIDPAVAKLRREGETEDRIETRGLEFQSKVRAEYLRLAQENPQRIVTLDGAKTREALHEAVIAELRRRDVNIP
jgi:dTMP kinase